MRRRIIRSRVKILLLLACIIAIGIWSRIPGGGFPLPIKAVGDVLWATMFYFWVLLIVPRMSVLRAVTFTLVISFAIEFLKLYHARWIESLRVGRITGFLLGHTFYWHDFASYVVGTVTGIAVDLGLVYRKRR